MAASREFLEFLKEQLAGLGPVSTRNMFGGAGIYHDGLMFGLVADDVLYLKADDSSKAAFEAEGLPPFTYGAKGGKKAVMSYWRAPARCLDDPDEMRDWAAMALSIARKSSSKRR